MAAKAGPSNRAQSGPRHTFAARPTRTPDLKDTNLVGHVILVEGDPGPVRAIVLSFDKNKKTGNMGHSIYNCVLKEVHAEYLYECKVMDSDVPLGEKDDFKGRRVLKHTGAGTIKLEIFAVDETAEGSNRYNVMCRDNGSWDPGIMYVSGPLP